MEKIQPQKNNTATLKPIVITERDKAVLARVADYRILTTEQISHLCFPSMSRTRKRLFQLWRHGYLRRIARPMRMGEGSSMYLYMPSRRGTQLIPPAQSARHTPRRGSPFNADHTLAINSFKICLELAIRGSKFTSLESWKEGKELLMKTTVKSEGDVLKRIPIIPDAYFALKQSERTYHYLLEIDRGTTDLRRIALKCSGYLNLWQERIVQTKFVFKSFRILYITNGEKRLLNMLELLRRMKVRHARLDLIYLTGNKAYSLAEPARLFEPIWKTVDTYGTIVTTSLLPSIPIVSSRQRAENHHCAVQNPIPVNGSPGSGG